MTVRAGAVATRPAAAFVFFFSGAMGALVFGDQRLTIRDRDLIIVRMDFAEGEEAVTIAAVVDKCGLE